MDFLSRSEITVRVEEAEALERAFEDRARLVDALVGFLGLELLRDIVDWLARLLAVRGMPTLLFEYQLEHLGRAWRRDHGGGDDVLSGAAAQLRAARLSVLEPSTFAACDQLCRAASAGKPRRGGTGLLIASAVADRATGIGAYDDALLRWLCDAQPENIHLALACASAHERAVAGLRAAGSVPS